MDYTGNREHFVALTRATSTIVANTFFQKHPEHNITYKP